MRIVQTIAPTVEPVTLAEARLHLRVDFTDDDSLVTSLIVAARMYCETRLRQALVTQTSVLYLDSFPSAGGYYNRAIREVWPSLGGMPSGLGFYPGMIPNSTGVIDIPLPPLQSVVAVQYYDFTNTLQTFPTSSYIVSTGFPGRIQPAYSKVWPISRPTIDSVLITFVSGYGASASNVPETTKAAMKLALGNWYENREAVASGAFMNVPDSVDALLSVTDHGQYA